MASDVKWIKITTDIFDDEKILLIESMPDAYAIITVWFKLLCLAGKQNNNGVFLMSNRIPYTEKMLATIFRMKESTVQLALRTFEEFHMIEIVDGVITIPNWNKHQTLDAYEKKKERDRIYQKERRAAQRALIEKLSDWSSDKSSDIAISEREGDKEEDKEEDNIKRGSTKEVTYKAKPENDNYPSLYGIYQNVFLSESEYITLQEEFPLDYEKKIDRLSAYMKQKGKSYDSHFAVIREWAIEDSQKQKKTDSRRFVRNERIFRGDQRPEDEDITDICMRIMVESDEPKQLPSEKEVEAFRQKIEAEYADYLPEQRESFVESFRKGNWKK